MIAARAVMKHWIISRLCLTQQTRRFSMGVASEMMRPQEERFEPPPINVTTSKDGILDSWIQDAKYEALLHPDTDPFQIYYYRSDQQVDPERDPDSIAFFKDDILKMFPGYPRDPVYEQYLATEVKRMREKQKDLMIMDVREEWELDISKLEGDDVYYVDQRKILSFDKFEMPWGFGKIIMDGILPEPLKNQEANIVVMCGDGETGTCIAALLYGLGWNNVSVMLGGMNAWQKSVDPSLEKYHMFQKPRLDIEQERSDNIQKLLDEKMGGTGTSAEAEGGSTVMERLLAEETEKINK
eukprot:568633_1